jgi:hypothetical protein
VIEGVVRTVQVTVCGDRRNRMHAIAPVVRGARSSWPLLLAIALMSASVGTSAVPAGAQSEAKCPVGALRGATSPVEITFWHGETSTNEGVLEELVARFEAGQSRVRVNLVNQVTIGSRSTSTAPGWLRGTCLT